MGNKNSTGKVRPVDIYTSRGEIINLKGKIINIPEGSWYNLGTSRVNKNKPAGALFDERYHVFGTEPELEAFYFRNHIVENPVCKLDNQGSVVFAPNIEDIEKVPESYLQNLCYFNLIGLQTKGKIVEIIDADTVDICFHLKLSFLYNPRPNLDEPEGKKQQISLITSSKPTSPKIADSGLFIKMRARLANIDAAEHQSLQGILATQKMTQLFATTKNIVYIQCQEFDKYGRILVDLYSDPNYKNYLNYYLIQNPDPVLGVLAEKYSGKTKSDYMKNLPTV
jgi:hypothetical protein